MEGDRAREKMSGESSSEWIIDQPNHSVVLLLADVVGHFAVNLSSAERHSQGFRHVILDRRWNCIVLVRRSDPHIRSTDVLELACSQLRYLSSGHQRQDHVCGKALLEMCFNPEAVCRVDQDTCVLRRHDRLDDRCKVVDIRQSFDAQQDVIESRFPSSGIFWRSDHCGSSVEHR